MTFSPLEFALHQPKLIFLQENCRNLETKAKRPYKNFITKREHSNKKIGFFLERSRRILEIFEKIYGKESRRDCELSRNFRKFKYSTIFNNKIFHWNSYNPLRVRSLNSLTVREMMTNDSAKMHTNWSKAITIRLWPYFVEKQQWMMHICIQSACKVVGWLRAKNPQRKWKESQYYRMVDLR